MKIAVIGTGRMGQRHIQVVKDLGAELVGICDSNEGVLIEAAQAQNVPESICFTDALTMLKATGPEAVVVATTAPYHCALTCLAAEMGARYVLCEKPMAVSLEECDRMIKACRTNGVKLAINHQMRFMEQYTKAKRIIQSEEFGGLSSVTVVAGNFGLAMNGCHYFEMFRYMTDEPPVEVTAWFSEEHVPNPRGPQYEDRAGQVRLTTRSGQRFYMEAGADQGHGVKVIYAGPYSQLVVDELTGTMSLVVREEQYRDMPTTRYGMPAIESMHKITPADSLGPSRAVLEALINDRDFPRGEDGRLAVSVLVAAYLSDESNHVPLQLEEHLPLTRVFPWA